MSCDLTDAAWQGDLDAVRRLVAAGADLNAPDDDGVVPLVCASIGRVAFFDALVDAGARLDPGVLVHCLNWACSSHNMPMVEHLLQLGADIEARAGGQTALHAAVDGCDLAVVNRILAAGARVDVRDRLGRTPLHFAAMFRQVPMLEPLVRVGADVLATDLDGATALDLVLRRDAIAFPEACAVGQDELNTAAWLRAAMAGTHAS